MGSVKAASVRGVPASPLPAPSVMRVHSVHRHPPLGRSTPQKIRMHKIHCCGLCFGTGWLLACLLLTASVRISQADCRVVITGELGTGFASILLPGARAVPMRGCVPRSMHTRFRERPSTFPIFNSPGAGRYTAGGPTSGVPATSATLSVAEGVWPDGAGGLLITDNQNHAVRRVSASGIVTTIAGWVRRGRVRRQSHSHSEARACLYIISPPMVTHLQDWHIRLHGR